MLNKKFLFLTLKTFSTTGGIEKVCKLLGKALYEITIKENDAFKLYSLHDNVRENVDKYIPQNTFKGFKSDIKKFIFASINATRHSDVIILSHINLLPVGCLLKFLFPNKKLVMLAHGIEIWEGISLLKRKMINKCDLILAVSNFTKDKIITNHKINGNKVLVLNNCLDPYLVLSHKNKSELRRTEGIPENSVVLLCVSRYSNHEQYKGYDTVLNIMNELHTEIPNIHFLMVGKYDVEEKNRLDALIHSLSLAKYVTFTGFVADDILPEYFKLSDIFIMPSDKEGFGIVFIEAMFFGLPVIAGNRDGTTDALLNGKLGVLVDPKNDKQIKDEIIALSKNLNLYSPDKALLTEHFGFYSYKNKLQKIMDAL